MHTILASVFLVATATATSAMAAPQLCHGTTCIDAPGMDQRLALVAYLANRPASGTISCDAVSGAPKTGCAVLEGMITDVRRAARFQTLAKGWTSPQRSLFSKLLVAEETFARAVGENETDRMASEAGSDAITARQAETAAFAHTLEKVAANDCSAKNPSGRLSFVAFGDSDAALNAAYAQVMAVGDTSDLAWGSVDKDGIRRTQRAWIAYRDTFVTFAAALDCDAEAVKSELTQRRTVSLEGFLAD